MEDRVYFIHTGFGLSADFFVKSELAEQYSEYWADYLVEDCVYVQAFLKEHPDYKYVGSTDNMHINGWGMSFDGFTEVDCPKVEGDEK